MGKKKEIEQRIVAMWLSRPDGMRDYNETEPFTVEVWNAGFRLSHHPDIHYQHVMNLIRELTRDSE